MRKILAILVAAAAACGGGGSGGGSQTPTVATPVISPAGGTFATTQTATITCATAGATIRYTTDGSTPTGSSPAYAGGVPIAATGTVLRAFAQAAGQNDSAVASATFVLQAAAPVASPAAGTYAASQSVTLTSATPGAAIRYTTDGSAPAAGSPTYAAPIPVAATATIRAVATRLGFADSAVTSATYTIDAGATPAATPTFSPVAGTYTSAQSVTISSTTPGATIHYTTSGADPTTASTVFTPGSPISVSATTTLKAIAVAPGFTQSAVGTAAYTIDLPQPTATPIFSPVAGTYASAQSVTISCATAGATIYYTTNGADPTTASTVFSPGSPISVPATTTIKALATSAGRPQSAIATATYTIAGGGTGFATLCPQVVTVQEALLASCAKINPALLGTPQFQLDFCPDLLKEISAGRIAYDAGQGAACLAGFQAQTCADLLPGGGFATPAACDAALAGQVAQGASCYTNDSCQAGFCSAERTQTCPGTCQPFAQSGQSCASADCADGLVCDFSGTAPVCRTAAAAGGACPCQDGLWCDTAGGAPGTCRTLPAAGATCAPGNACATGAECVGGTCRAAVGGGAACGATAPCGPGWYCAAGSCVSWPGVGASCAESLGCIGGYCDFFAADPVCVAYRTVGQTCNPALFGFDCDTGNCDAGVCAAAAFCPVP